MAKSKIILFGGTFDPIHKGHIGVAKSALDIINAEKLIFVPAKRSALKSDNPCAPDAHRLQMIKLAIENINKFKVSSFELERPAQSYTIDTVRHFQRKSGKETKLHWLIGADSVAELPHWYKIKELIDECYLTCMYRAGYEKPDFTQFKDSLGERRVKKLQENIIETPLIDISSTEIRRRLSEGKDADDMLPAGVAEYIRRHKLYR